MKREDAEVFYDVYERALKVLSEAETVLWKLPKGKERDEYVHAHTRVIADILSELRAPLVLQYRDLDTNVPEGPPDTLLEPSEQEAVDQLSSAQVQRIDEALLADCAPSWRKVARVAGDTMMRLSKEVPRIPDGYYAQRIASLVDEGLLESQGNLNYMRFSEVRLRQDVNRDV